MLKRISILGLCLGLLAVVSVAITVTAQAEAQSQSTDAGLQAYDNGDYATALKEFTPLAERGHAEAQYQLGLMYGLGNGVAQSYDIALEWFSKAAEQHHAKANYFALGIRECRRLGGCWVNEEAPLETSQIDG